MNLIEFISKVPDIDMSKLSKSDIMVVSEFIRLLNQASNDLDSWLNIQKFRLECDSKMKFINELTQKGLLTFNLKYKTI